MMLYMEDVDLSNQVVLIREDFNVPLKDGKITHSIRIDAALPTLKTALAAGAKVIVMSHLGRPKEGQFDPALSLQPIAAYLSAALKQPVPLFSLTQGRPTLQQGQIALLENVRFLVGEEENSPQLAKALAQLCDVFVMDAFAVAHRAQASTCGVAEYAPIACAGPLLQKELAAIHQILIAPQHPVVAIVGGAKVSTKLNILTHLLDKVDVLVVGGGIANTFLAAQGHAVGASLYEPELIPIAKDLLEQAQQQNKTIWIPEDVVVGQALNDEATGIIKGCTEVQTDDKIFDIGPKAVQSLQACIATAKTVLWNGPVGVFEYAAFSEGTQALAKAIAQTAAFTVAGGGDTLAAIEKFKVADKLSYLSTGGGAFLEMLEGITLPAVAVLAARQQKSTAVVNS